MSLFLTFFNVGTVFAYLGCNENFVFFLKNNRKRRIKMKQTLKKNHQEL